VNAYAVRPVNGPIVGSIRPPGSKSYTNRALPLAAIAKGRSTIRHALESDDVDAMLGALTALGVQTDFDHAAKSITIQGCGGPFPVSSATLDLVNSGTSLRFLAALVAAGRGTFVLDGNQRMRERPVGDLLDGLRQLGVETRCLGAEGCPPIELKTNGLTGGAVSIKADVSSQYLSGLLMAAPLAVRPVEFRVSGGLVSKPYVLMTLEAMRAFGVSVDSIEDGVFRIQPQRYVGCDYEVEADASAASYWFAAAAITKGRVTVEGLGRHSIQGDLQFVRVLERMGCTVEQTDDSTTVIGGGLRGGDFDLHHMSDTVPTLAAVACFADGPTTIRNVANVRVKECDRITAMATELGRLGVKADEFADGLTITPSAMKGAAVQTYDDHRIAMSLALVGLRVPGVLVSDPHCVRKTYPDFWKDLEHLTSGLGTPTT
jgi:3-phosphoshikimate 1-carboxyvinyltransferase